MPPCLATQWSHVEDDELVWRVHRHYGDEAIVKLVYIIAKFDVGKKDGGLQTHGVATAKSKQLQEAHTIMHEHADDFYAVKTARGSDNRTSGERVRMRTDWRTCPEVLIHGKAMGKEIERCVKSKV